MPSRQRWQRPQPACTSTVMRSPTSNSSTVGPSFTTVPIYSWPGVKPLLKGDPPSMIAGSPCLMISMSVAQTAMASMRTSTSARPGSGTGFSTRVSSSGPPSTQAFMVLGIVNALVCDAMCGLPGPRLSWSIGRGRPRRRPSRPDLASVRRRCQCSLKRVALHSIIPSCWRPRCDGVLCFGSQPFPRSPGRGLRRRRSFRPSR